MTEPPGLPMSTGRPANKAPAYQHYAKDWLVETVGLTLEEQGACQRLLDHQWVEGSLPDNPKALARRLGATVRRFAAIWPSIERFFPRHPQDPTRRANPDLETKRQKLGEYHAAQAEKGRRSARARSTSGSSRGSTRGQPRPQPKAKSSSASPSPTTAAPSGAAEDAAAQPEGEPPICEQLRAFLPEPYREALDGFVRAARNPSGLAYAVRALGPGGIHERYSWQVVGRALFELAADRDPTYNTKRFEAFCGRIAQGEHTPGPAGSDAERMRRALEELEREATQA